MSFNRKKKSYSYLKVTIIKRYFLYSHKDTVKDLNYRSIHILQQVILLINLSEKDNKEFLLKTLSSYMTTFL
ncbi:hypothetical protein DB91_03355 [Ehrlichia sp. Wisconsin_h]|nr:hypothetical protein DB91_03355 [Ehrlichia sp. Wisconsin_h]